MRELKSSDSYRVGDQVLAILPPHNDREVCKIIRIVKTDRGVRFKVEDEDSVCCWIGPDDIIREV